MANNLLFTNTKTVQYSYCNNGSTEQIPIIFEFIDAHNNHYEKNDVLKKAIEYNGIDMFAKDNRDMFACAFNDGYADEVCEIYKYINRYISWNELLRTAKNVKSRRELKMKWTVSYSLFKLYTDLLYQLYGKKRRLSEEKSSIIAHKYLNIWELYYDDYEAWLFIKNKTDYGLGKFYKEYNQKEWTEEEVISHASHYERYIDFLSCEEFAFEYALYYDLFDNKITHLIGKMLGNAFWTKERIKKFCSKFEKRVDFYMKYPGVQVACQRNGWRDDCIDIPTFSRKMTYTYEECEAIAKQCTYNMEMYRLCPTAYQWAKDNNWLKDYTWFDRNKMLKYNNFVVYVNLSEEYNFAYVGITRDWRVDIRYAEHQQQDDDSLLIYCNNLNIDIPEPTILKESLTGTEAQYWEGYYCDYYKERNYDVVNIAKTGIGSSSLGGGFIKWTEERCYEEALKYTRYYDFEINSQGAYKRSKLFGWIDDYTWLERSEHNNYTDESIIEEALKYEYFEDFVANKKYYDAAYNHKITDKIRSMMKSRVEEYKNTFNFDYCIKVAKQFTLTREFNQKAVAYYNYSIQNDFMKHFYWFDKYERYWTYDKCREEFLKYDTVEDFEKNCYGGYHISLEKGWLEDYKNNIYYEYKSKRNIYPRCTNYDFKVMYQLNNIDNVSEEHIMDYIVSKNIFDKSLIDYPNCMIKMKGTEYSKYADCYKYFYKDELYLIKKDLKAEYSKYMGFKYIKKLIENSVLKPLPIINDFDNIDVSKLIYESQYVDFIESTPECRSWFHNNFYDTINYDNIENIKFILAEIRKQYESGYTKPCFEDISTFDSKSPKRIGWWLFRGWSREYAENILKEHGCNIDDKPGRDWTEEQIKRYNDRKVKKIISNPLF